MIRSLFLLFDLKECCNQGTFTVYSTLKYKSVQKGKKKGKERRDFYASPPTMINGAERDFYQP